VNTSTKTQTGYGPVRGGCLLLGYCNETRAVVLATTICGV